MSRTRLRIDLPADSWLGAVSRSFPDATLRVTGTAAADDADVTALAVTGADRAGVVERVRGLDRVDDVDVVERRAAETVVRVAGPPPSYVAAARRAGAPVEPPVEVGDGRATLAAVGDRERLSVFGRRLAAAGATVKSAGGDGPEPVLTEAQRDLVRAAIEAGYYDTPRRCTLTELAAERDIAKSTCSETLHRAEGRVLRWFVEEGFGADAPAANRGASGAPVDGLDDGGEGDAARGSEATGVPATEPWPATEP